MSKQLRLGIIGAGHRGYILPLWHQPEGRSIITAVAEIDKDALERFKNNVTNEAFLTNDYKELLNRDDVDAVVVLTEDFNHKQHAIDTFKAGKDLFLEKPMAISIEDSQDILYAWKESGKKLMIGFNMRYMPMYQTMKKYIDDGVIGDVKAIWIRHFVGRGGKYYFQDWHRNRKTQNSLLLQKASHDIDMIHMFSDSYVSKVSAFGSLDFYNDLENFEKDGLEHQTEDPIDVEDNNVVIMELENGIKVAYLQNHFTPDYQRSYVIIGTKGRIENDEVNEKIIIKTRQTGTLEDMSNLEITMKPTEGVHAGADPRITEAFVKYILDDIEPEASPLDGYMSVAVGIKGTESLRSGGELKFVKRPN